MFKKVLLTLTSTLISLVVVEFILRAFFPVYPLGTLRAYQYDDELAVRLKPGIHSLETTDFQQELRVNGLGTVNFQESFDDYSSIVFAVGDSYTQGTGLPSDMSYPAQLDMILNRRSQVEYSRTYGVVNLGLAAYGGEQNLIALRRFSGSIRKPAFILYLGCDNDLEDDQLFLSGYRHSHIVDGNPKWEPFVRPLQWLTNDLQIGLHLKVIVGNLRRSSFRANRATEASASVAEMEGPVLDRLNAFAKESDAVLVVSWVGSADSYNWSKQWAEKNGVLFADWMPRVDSVTSNISEMPRVNPHSGGHLRGWVNRIIAEEFERQIRSTEQ